MYLIKRASIISGVSVRTLHHYDEIGLLCPKKEENGYRYYSEDDMATLQSILFYKYLGFSLKEIKNLLKNKDEEILARLKNQLALMENEKKRLLTLIKTLRKTIESEERKINMPTEEKFKGFKYEDNEKYIKEAKEKYGNEVIEKSLEKQKDNEKEVEEGFNNIFFAFADNMKKAMEVSSNENLKLAEDLHEYICKFSFDCTLDIFSKIGLGYVQDPKFKENIDKYSKGTAQYVSDIIQEYVKEMKK